VLRVNRISFLFGLLAGFCLAGMVVAAGLYFIADHGVMVVVDADEIARRLRDEVEAAVSHKLPELIAEAKRTVPQRVAQEMAGRLNAASIEISGVKIFLPAGSLARLEAKLQETVQTILFQILDEMNQEETIHEFTRETHQRVLEAIYKELDGRTILIEPGYRGFHPFSIPLVITVKGGNIPSGPW